MASNTGTTQQINELVSTTETSSEPSYGCLVYLCGLLSFLVALFQATINLKVFNSDTLANGLGVFLGYWIVSYIVAAVGSFGYKQKKGSVVSQAAYLSFPIGISLFIFANRLVPSNSLLILIVLITPITYWLYSATHNR
ncbi:MAG: hypothetical protein ACD_22C00047G0011 [uncultured bacterium]|nr:MAG: hypothetical protein ACD_22C00047G0011 [uncultured bacterium]